MEIKNASTTNVSLQVLLSQLWYSEVVELAGWRRFRPWSIHKLDCNCPLSELRPRSQCWEVFCKVPLTSSRSLTASVFPHRAASCRAVPALVCLLMSIPAWINSLTAGGVGGEEKQVGSVARDEGNKEGVKFRGNTAWRIAKDRRGERVRKSRRNRRVTMQRRGVRWGWGKEERQRRQEKLFL